MIQELETLNKNFDEQSTKLEVLEVFKVSYENKESKAHKVDPNFALTLFIVF